MKAARVFEKELMIPTYDVGKEEKNPMFFEKRVYQGSSGRVYPNPVIEKIEDVKKDRVYRAVILECGSNRAAGAWRTDLFCAG